MSKPVGPYTPAVRAGDFLFVSGQLGLRDGAMVGPGLEEQVVQAIANLRALLGEHGATLDHIAKVTVFLTDMEDFPAMNVAYVAEMGDARPARSTIGVAALPMGARFEIEAIAKVS